MKSPRQLSDQDLLEQTEKLVQEERELLLAILRHLLEIERRKLYSTLKCRSLHHYAVQHLKYSDTEARLRISAMMLLKDVPEVEEKVQEGEITLTNLSIAQSFIRKEKIEEKSEMLEQFCNKSVREAQKLTYELGSNPTPLPKERVRVVSAEHVQMSFLADKELEDKIEKVKGLVAHTHPGVSLAGLVSHLCDLAIEKYDLAQRKTQRREATSAPATGKRRHISIQTKKKVWERAKSKCEQCGSTHALQIDHQIPLAHNGSNDETNLRLLCRNCNIRAGIEKVGLENMKRN